MRRKRLLQFIMGSLLTTLLLSFTFGSSKDYWLEYINKKLDEYTNLYAQQKVYLQLDRDEYTIGSTIWYKAYILNSKTGKPETTSTNLYVELVSPDTSTFMHRLLKIKEGYAHGDFPVLDTIKTGMYQIKAYTSSMKNSGKDYLFTKDIRIIHPTENYYRKTLHKKAKNIVKSDIDIDLQFFPEGGELVHGLSTRMAFKAIDQNGKGIDVEGTIFSRKGQQVKSFKTVHQGMGAVNFAPQSGQKYYAEIVLPKGKKKKIELPEVRKEGYNLKIMENESQFKLAITTNKKFGNDPVAKTVYLFAQQGGKVYYSEKLGFDKQSIAITLAKDKFPTGVVDFTLFDGQGKPHCERLAFVNHKDQLQITSNFSSKIIKKRQKVDFYIDVSDGNMPAEGEFSVAVKNKSQTSLSRNKQLNIQNYLLLKADIQGQIENPEHYFTGTKQSQKDLDLLMLTQGWRKFTWKDVLVDSIAKPEFPQEKDLRITGRITKYFFDISVKNAKVTMTLLNKYNDVFETYSRKKGKFEFLGMNYSDTLDVLIEVRTQWGRKNVMILPDQDRKLPNKFNPYKGYFLDSLLVKRKRVYKKTPVAIIDTTKPEITKLYSHASNTVKLDKPHYSSYTSVMDAIREQVPGMSLHPGGSSIRGGGEPLYLLDGVQTDYNTINSIHASEVDHIDVLKGPDAAIYGIKGGNGVIAVYTKRGHYYKRGEIRFKMLAYHTPKKFYSPKYLPNYKSKSEDTRKTIYWNPQLKTDKNGRAHISFYHSDVADDFEIVIEGMDKKGKLGYLKQDYMVKK